MLDWLSVFAHVTPLCTTTLKLLAREKYWSTGTLPFNITFFISYFAGSFAAYFAAYLAAGLTGLSSAFFEAERSLLVLFGSVFDFLRSLLSASSAFIFLEGSSSLGTDLSSCLPRVRVFTSGSGGAGWSAILSSLGALLRVEAFGGIDRFVNLIRI
jgi:hypothetical protein